MEHYINDIIRPKLQGDGGEIVFGSFDDSNNTLYVIMKGECSKCPILHRCLDWIKERVKIDLSKDINISALRKKPYFWDN